MRKHVILFSLLAALSTQISAENRGLHIVNIPDEAGREIRLYQESHALLIGNSDYTEGWLDLPGVADDIQAVSAALEAQGFQISVVMNPTRVQLEQALNDFINQYGLQTENRLLFYFAGHGHTERLTYGEDMGYIVPCDAPDPHENLQGFLSKAMDMQMIEVYAKRIQAKHALFLFDSCFSGSLFALSRAMPEHISHKSGQPVRQFLTSGSADEQVPDESLFRRQFIAALQGEADVNHDGYVTGSELGEFLQETVINYSKGSQHPQYGKIRNPHLDKGDFIFQIQIGGVIIAPPAVSAGQSVDPELEMWTLVKQSSNPSDVEDFLAAFPNGRLAEAAKLQLKQLQRQQAAASQPSPKPSLIHGVSSTGSIGAFAADWWWSKARQQDGRYGVASLNMPEEFASLALIDAAILLVKSSYSQEAGRADANVYISAQPVNAKDAAHNKGACWYSDRLTGREHFVGTYATVAHSSEEFRFDVTEWIRANRSQTYFVMIENEASADLGVGSIRLEFGGVP